MKHFLAPLLAKGDARFALQNARTGVLLAGTIEGAFDSRTRRTGLLGRDAMPPDTALVIAPCSAIHTFFMRFAIDVLFVSSDGRVRKIREHMEPWGIAAAFGSFATIELAAGVVSETRTTRDDSLQVIPT